MLSLCFKKDWKAGKKRGWAFNREVVFNRTFTVLMWYFQYVQYT